MEVLRLPQVRQRTGLGKTALYSRIKANQFPAPFALGLNARAKGWLKEDVDRWISEQVKRRAAAPAEGI